MELRGDALEWINENIKTLDAVGGVKQFPHFEYLTNFIRLMETNRILLIAKSRQMFATWAVCAYIIYSAIHKESGIYLLLSKGGRDTSELIKRQKLMIRHLPQNYQDGIEVRRGEVSFPNGSRILSLPATEDAVRMHSPSCIFWDEMAFTARSDAIWASVKPAVDSGGSFFGISTPNGTDNIFYHLFTDHENGFCKWKLHWRQRIDRGVEWAKNARRGLSDAKWKQEYEVDFNALASRVFDEFEQENHVINKNWDKVPSNGLFFRGIDFGYRHPYVIWAHQHADGLITIFDEWEGEDVTVEEMGECILKIDQKWGLKQTHFSWSACDPAGAAATDAGLSAVERLQKIGFNLRYRNSAIMTGIEWVKSSLKVQMETSDSSSPPIASELCIICNIIDGQLKVINRAKTKVMTMLWMRLGTSLSICMVRDQRT